MNRPFPRATVASCFALAGFAVAMVAGLRAERSAADVLTAGLIAMTVCYAVGALAARAAEITVREHLDARRTAGATGGSDAIGTVSATDTVTVDGATNRA